jgi:predicted nucleic acid-binding protein
VRIAADVSAVVAVALTLGAGIWTHDYDFFGRGVPGWITQTLTAHLESWPLEL